jgi:hypothetical protein
MNSVSKLRKLRALCDRQPCFLFLASQGGIGPAGLATEDLHVLDFTDPERPRWHRWVGFEFCLVNNLPSWDLRTSPSPLLNNPPLSPTEFLSKVLAPVHGMHTP